MYPFMVIEPELQFGQKIFKTAGPTVMALLTVSKELALMSSIFHGLAGNICLCVCVLIVTRYSSLTQKFGACTVSREW